MSYHYYIKDHLGNIRAVVNDNGNVEQTTHYYPSGAIIYDLSTNPSVQPYKYNGKELDRMHGLDWYDYGARNYDAPILAWDRMDPLCEKYYNISPYVYCMNNPVKFVDPDGRVIGDYYDLNGNYLASDGVDDGKKYIILDKQEAKSVKKTKDVSAVSMTVPLPTKNQIEAAQAAINAGKEAGMEVGFVMSVDGVSNLCYGVTGTVNLGDGYEELGNRSQCDAHYHPYDFRVKDGIPHYSDTMPSGDDFSWRTKREINKINNPNSPSWILGEEPNSRSFEQDANGVIHPNPTTTSIRFYWGNEKNSNPVKWKSFKKVALKLNR